MSKTERSFDCVAEHKNKKVTASERMLWKNCLGVLCSVLQDKVLMDENKQKMRRAIWRRRPGVTARALSLPPAPSLDNGHATHTCTTAQRTPPALPTSAPALSTRGPLHLCVCVREYVRTIENSFEIIEQLDFGFSLVPRTCLVNRRRPQ